MFSRPARTGYEANLVWDSFQSSFSRKSVPCVSKYVLSPAKVAVSISKTFSARPPVFTFSNTVATADLLVALSSSIAGMLYVGAGLMTASLNPLASSRSGRSNNHDIASA